jgi:hypothetical protein
MKAQRGGAQPVRRGLCSAFQQTRTTKLSLESLEQRWLLSVMPLAVDDQYQTNLNQQLSIELTQPRGPLAPLLATPTSPTPRSPAASKSLPPPVLKSVTPPPAFAKPWSLGLVRNGS